MASSSAVTLDDLAPPHSTNLDATNTPTPDDHLFFPTIDDKEPATERGGSPVEQPRQVLKDRLYIGNLHPSVDEYTLLQVFSKFGKVTKLDYLFHKTGLLKGKPRGYAFIEYGNKDDALKALTMAHEKPLRGRKLIVTFAHQAPLDQYGGVGIPSSLKSRKTMMDTGRPTTLSMLKTGMSNRHEGKTGDKIAMMEAKLRQMESTNPRPKPTPSSGDVNMDAPSLPGKPSSGSFLPFHPSLPMKPPPTLPDQQTNIKRPPPPKPQLMSKPKPSASPLSILPPTLQSSATTPLLKSVSSSSTSGSGSQARSGKANKLIGVKIKAKEKEPGKS
ncbi:hypothetical protein BDZ97DRAFT_1842014 [Flammula alnicola]|nr:hypothetical protein BDZ97DRAFT_1842014 [Flammula alnicola]